MCCCDVALIGMCWATGWNVVFVKAQIKTTLKKKLFKLNCDLVYSVINSFLAERNSLTND